MLDASNRARGGKRKGAGRKPDKVIKDIRALAGQYRAEAIERLAFWMASNNPKASVAAANALLDRSDGRPVQSVMPVDDKGQYTPYSLTVRINDGKNV